MTVTNTTSKTGFFRSIGNWFNRNGSTLGKSLDIIGSTAVGVGYTGMMINEMGKNASIFRYSSYGFNNSMMSQIMMMQMMNMDFPSFYSTTRFTNPYLPGNQSYYPYIPYNYQQFPYIQNNIPQSYYQYNNSLSKYNFNQTELTESEKNYKELGKAFNDGTNNLKIGDNNSSFDLNIQKADTKEKTEENYKNGIKQYGKSYTTFIDKDSDGYIDENEFTTNESDIDKNSAKQVFKLYDLDGDGKLGWEEMSSVIKTFDRDNDGKITKSELESVNRQIATQSNNFRTYMVNSFKFLFGQDSISRD